MCGYVYKIGDGSKDAAQQEIVLPNRFGITGNKNYDKKDSEFVSFSLLWSHT